MNHEKDAEPPDVTPRGSGEEVFWFLSQGRGESPARLRRPPFPCPLIRTEGRIGPGIL